MLQKSRYISISLKPEISDLLPLFLYNKKVHGKVGFKEFRFKDISGNT